MKKLLLIIAVTLLLTGSAYTEEVNYPYDDFKLQNTYQINDGKTVYIEQTPVGHTIWVKDKSSKELNKISNVWFFLGISKECEGEKSNVLFATQKEYYMWGGIDDEPTIRIYNLYEPDPHFTNGTALGMVPHMKEAKQFCTFYEPVK
jgi:hypothetical protein